MQRHTKGPQFTVVGASLLFGSSRGRTWGISPHDPKLFYPEPTMMVRWSRSLNVKLIHLSKRRVVRFHQVSHKTGQNVQLVLPQVDQMKDNKRTSFLRQQGLRLSIASHVSCQFWGPVKKAAEREGAVGVTNTLEPISVLCPPPPPPLRHFWLGAPIAVSGLGFAVVFSSFPSQTKPEKGTCEGMLESAQWDIQH